MPSDQRTARGVDAGDENGSGPRDFPAGARIHQAVQVIRRAPTDPVHQPTPTEPGDLRPGLPRPSRRDPDPSVDLFGASAAAETPLPDEGAGEATPAVEATTPAHPDIGAADDTDVVVDLRDEATSVAGAATTIHVSESRSWADAPTGWVRNVDGGLEWHPVITTAERLDRWEVDVALGIVTVDVMLFGVVHGERVAAARRDALAELISETVRRGGHGVVAVAQSVTQLRDGLLVTATGSAVTLQGRSTRLP